LGAGNGRRINPRIKAATSQLQQIHKHQTQIKLPDPSYLNPLFHDRLHDERGSHGGIFQFEPAEKHGLITTPLSMLKSQTISESSEALPREPKTRKSIIDNLQTCASLLGDTIDYGVNPAVFLPPLRSVVRGDAPGGTVPPDGEAGRLDPEISDQIEHHVLGALRYRQRWRPYGEPPTASPRWPRKCCRNRA
jgi:hypothetical protein